MKVLCIQNFSNGDPGRVGEALVRCGVECTTVKSYRTDVLPDPRSFSAVAVFGSPTSCRDVTDHPELLQVRDLMRKCLEIDKPVLGICYGAQLLAHVLGAEVRRSSTPEYGGYEVRLKPEGRRHALFADFPEFFTAAQFHEDTFDLPTGAEWLAWSGACRHQAFAVGRHVGLQFHLEATPAMVARWVAECPVLLERIGKSPEQATSELSKALREQAPLCELFVDRFVRAVEST